MDTVQINYLLLNLKCYNGTFPRDLLRTNLIKKPCALIVNTDDSFNPGQHWIALFILKNNTAEYFDNFGIYPLQKDILNFLSKNKIKKIIYNSKQLQLINNNTYGAYCVLFVKCRCSNINYCDIISLFSSNTLDNDLKASLSLLL